MAARMSGSWISRRRMRHRCASRRTRRTIRAHADRNAPTFDYFRTKVYSDHTQSGANGARPHASRRRRRRGPSSPGHECSTLYGFPSLFATQLSARRQNPFCSTRSWTGTGGSGESTSPGRIAWVAVEYDGFEWHSSSKALRRDRQKRAGLEELVWRVMSIVSDDVRRQPRAMVRRIDAHLNRVAAA